MKTLFVLIGVSFVLAAILLLVRFRERSARSSAVEPRSGLVVDSRTAAERTLCLASFVLRAQTEYQLHPQPGDIPPRKPTPFDVVSQQNSWLKKEGLWDSCSNRERMLFQQTLGSWSRQDIADGQWREESFSVLVWALDGSRIFPPYDAPAAQADVARNFPKPEDAHAFIAKAKLRDSNEISKQRDIAELWLWRARTTQLQREGTKSQTDLTLEQIVTMTVEKAASDGLFKPIDKDFPALGKPYSRLTEAEWQTMRSIATERLYVLNWLCGYSEDWDNVRTST